MILIRSLVVFLLFIVHGYHYLPAKSFKLRSTRRLPRPLNFHRIPYGSDLRRLHFVMRRICMYPSVITLVQCVYACVLHQYEAGMHHCLMDGNVLCCAVYVHNTWVRRTLTVQAHASDYTSTTGS